MPEATLFFRKEVVMTHNRNKRVTIWTLVITSLALFMVSLDNLVVTTALPVIRRDLHATISQLEWTVNAYTLTFAVLLLTRSTLHEPCRVSAARSSHRSR
jgi:predicted MFS family arabinose efflux permease